MNLYAIWDIWEEWAVPVVAKSRSVARYMGAVEIHGLTGASWGGYRDTRSRVVARNVKGPPRVVEDYDPWLKEMGWVWNEEV